MTEEQNELREERIAIMMESGISELDAIRHCNEHPYLYGYPDGR